MGAGGEFCVLGCQAGAVERLDPAPGGVRLLSELVVAVWNCGRVRAWRGWILALGDFRVCVVAE